MVNRFAGDPAFEPRTQKVERENRLPQVVVCLPMPTTACMQPHHHNQSINNVNVKGKYLNSMVEFPVGKPGEEEK